jgi:hypothetical protein
MGRHADHRNRGAPPRLPAAGAPRLADGQHRTTRREICRSVSSVAGLPWLGFDRVQVSGCDAPKQLTDAISWHRSHVPWLAILFDVLPNDQPRRKRRESPPTLVLDRHLGVLVVAWVVEAANTSLRSAAIVHVASDECCPLGGRRGERVAALPKAMRLATPGGCASARSGEPPPDHTARVLHLRGRRVLLGVSVEHLHSPSGDGLGPAA